MNAHYEQLLKEHNLSLTAVRLAVLEALQLEPHSEVGRIYDFVKSKIHTSSKQAIYNNLTALVEHGIVREIKPKGRPSLYETRTGDNHHHLICRSCQIILDVDCKLSPPCAEPSDNHGFVIDEAEIVLWGLCPTCQQTTTQSKL